MSNKTAEERAEKRYPHPEGIGQWSRADREHFLFLCKPNRHAYATCIREEVEPLEAEVAKLRALVKVLLYHGEALSALIEVAAHFKEGDSKHHWDSHVKSWEYARNKAKSQGFTSTNTTDK